MAAPETTPDLNSVLSHVNTLESEKKQMQEYLAKQNERIEKLTAGKKAEMKKTLEGMVDGWLNNIDISDEKVKEEFVSFPNQTFKSQCGRHNMDGIDIRFLHPVLVLYYRQFKLGFCMRMTITYDFDSNNGFKSTIAISI